jgi:hypothetical protein
VSLFTELPRRDFLGNEREKERVKEELDDPVPVRSGAGGLPLFTELLRRRLLGNPKAQNRKAPSLNEVVAPNL